jgi:hypothetical protein
MNRKPKDIVSAIVASSLVLTALNFETPAMAQRMSASKVRGIGRVLKSGMKKVFEGAATTTGENIGTGVWASRKSNPEYEYWYIVRMPNGQEYKVCQLARNGYNVGPAYYCGNGYG